MHCMQFSAIFFYTQMYVYIVGCHDSYMNQKQMQNKRKCCFVHQGYFIHHHQSTALTAQHGGDTQNKVIIIHEVLLCMLLHVLLQCYNSTYMNTQIKHATLTCLLLLTLSHCSACGS